MPDRVALGMPLATICGFPAAGKTQFAIGLVDYLRSVIQANTCRATLANNFHNESTLLMAAVQQCGLFLAGKASRVGEWS